jgi:hypothetical protein
VAKTGPIDNDSSIEVIGFIQVDISIFKFANQLGIDRKHLEIPSLYGLLLMEEHSRIPTKDEVASMQIRISDG